MYILFHMFSVLQYVYSVSHAQCIAVCVFCFTCSVYCSMYILFHMLSVLQYVYSVSDVNELQHIDSVSDAHGVEVNRSSMTSSTSQRAIVERSIPHTRIADSSRIADTYDVGNKLGEGSFGKVHEGTHRETKEKWAIKSINKEKVNKCGSSLLVEKGLTSITL